MKRVVDTSAWIEWIAGNWRSAAQLKEMPAREDSIVPTIVQLELAKWAWREAGSGVAERILGFTMLCRIVPLDTKIAVLAAEFSRLHKLATADAIIYATAIDAKADVLTCVARFKGLGSVVYVPKEG